MTSSFARNSISVFMMLLAASSVLVGTTGCSVGSRDRCPSMSDCSYCDNLTCGGAYCFAHELGCREDEYKYKTAVGTFRDADEPGQGLGSLRPSVRKLLLKSGAILTRAQKELLLTPLPLELAGRPHVKYSVQEIQSYNSELNILREVEADIERAIIATAGDTEKKTSQKDKDQIARDLGLSGHGELMSIVQSRRISAKALQGAALARGLTPATLKLYLEFRGIRVRAKK